MLIDDFMPAYDFAEKHDIEIGASIEKVYASLQTADLCDSSIIRFLFRLRGLPTEGLTLRQMDKMKFQVLGEQENRELLLGLAGKFWTPAGHLQNVDSGNFREFNEEGFAKATWNFSVNEVDKNKTRLSTETRIQTLDDTSRSRFGFYWTFVRPFSGWIRNEMLRIVKRKSEIPA